jgi:hypothetical protein
MLSVRRSSCLDVILDLKREIVAVEARRFRCAPIVLRAAFRSEKRLLISMVGKAYCEATGRKPGMSRNASGEIFGPFVGFTLEAARHYGVPSPDEERYGRRSYGKGRRKA